MKTSSIFLSQGCFYHRHYRKSISSLLWNSSHHASLPLPSLSHFLLLFFSTINNQGWGLYYFALLWRCRTIVNMCIICDPFTLLVFSVRLHYESWPRSTFFNWTICDRAFYCSTWLMLSEKPPPSPMRVFRSYAVTSSSPRRRHDGCIVGTRGGMARRENLAQSATRSQSHAGTCWLISEALRTEEAFPLKLAAQRWGNLGYNEGGCTCGRFSNTQRRVHVLPLKCGAHTCQQTFLGFRFSPSSCIVNLPCLLRWEEILCGFNIMCMREGPQQTKHCYGLTLFVVWFLF